MGTPAQWMGAIGFGTFFTLLMMLVNVEPIPKIFALRGYPRISALLNLCSLATPILAIGMVHEFDWQVLLHGKLGVLFGAATLGTVLLGLAARRAREQTEASSKPH